MSVLSAIRYIFPPVQYVTLPNLGIDISDTSLKYVQFLRKHARDTELQLKQWGSLDIKEGVIERGDIKDVQSLASILREVKKKTKIEYARISLPEERAYLFETSIKRGTPFKEIRGLLEFKLEENVPLSPRDAFFDYDIVDHQSDVSALRIVVAVYAKDTILNYYEACVSAGIIPLSFEIEAQAIARATVPKDARGTSMVVDFGKTRTGVGIVRDGALMYTSTIDLGGQDLSREMRAVMDGDVEEDTLTHIKNTQGLLPTANNEAVAQALKKTMSTVREELKTRVQYWNTRDHTTGDADLKRIVLCGGSSNLRGLPEFLGGEFSIPIVRADVWKNAFSTNNFIPQITKRYSYGYTTAVGLALTDFIEHNL